MPSWKDLAVVWNNVRELDLRPLREEAERLPRIAIAYHPAAAPHELARQLRQDPYRRSAVSEAPIYLLDLSAEGAADKLLGADLIILLFPDHLADDTRERLAAIRWANAGKPVLAFIHAPLAPPNPVAAESPLPPLDSQPPASEPAAGSPKDPAAANPDQRLAGELAEHWVGWGRRRVVRGPLDNPAFLLKHFVPAVLELLPSQHLALGRYFPLFRLPTAQRLIYDTCLSNATYALTTGLASTVPVMDVPLNLADMFMLTKTQAFLVYKLGLLLGYSTEWQAYLTEFGGVLGGGFLWRQLARQLVGLIPAWGIIPKVAVSYAGTFVVGQAVLQWYTTGQHVNAQQIRQFYGQAFARGKNAAQALLQKLPRPRLGSGPAKKSPKKPAKETLPRQVEAEQRCPQCSRLSAGDAAFCQYCGSPLDASPA
jgi:uncharacterized protein (DUF697 family)